MPVVHPNELTELQRQQIGCEVLRIFTDESDGVLGPRGARYEFDSFNSQSNCAPFESYSGITFAWGRRATESCLSVVGVPMRLSWFKDFDASQVRAAAAEIRSNWQLVQLDKALLKDRYRHAYSQVQLETLLGTFPNFDCLPLVSYCTVCARKGQRSPATKLMPKSTDKGETVVLAGVCDMHAARWWDGADWDGRHLVWTRAGT